jgi:hypothetical protein
VAHQTACSGLSRSAECGDLAPAAPLRDPPVELDARALLPAQWLDSGPGQDFCVYNPAIVRHRGRLLLAYRVDAGERSRTQTRIGICAFDDDLQVVPDSVRPLSDTVQDGGPWHYDPRFLAYGDRLFIH